MKSNTGYGELQSNNYGLTVFTMDESNLYLAHVSVQHKQLGRMWILACDELKVVFIDSFCKDFNFKYTPLFRFTIFCHFCTLEQGGLELFLAVDSNSQCMITLVNKILTELWNGIAF